MTAVPRSPLHPARVRVYLATLRHRIHNWRFGRKIAAGYILAVGIGTCGSLIGLVVADYFQGQGIYQLHDATAQSRLLGDLLRNLQTARLAMYQAQDSNRSPAQRTLFQQDAETALQQMRSKAEELKTYLRGNRAWLVADPETIIAQTQGALVALEVYLHGVEQGIHTTIDPAAPPSRWPQATHERAWLTLITVDRQMTHWVMATHSQLEQAEVDLENAQGLEKGIIIGSLGLAAVIAGIMALQVTRRITAPLIQVANVAETVASTGDLSQRVGITTTDEVGRLGRSLDQLIAAVAQRNADLDQAVRDARHQAATLHNTLNDLYTTQTQLIQSEKSALLGQVTAGVAHEINNPASFIYGNLAYLSTHLQDILALVALYEQGHPRTSPEVEDLAEAIDLDFMREDLPKLIQSMQLGVERIKKIVVSLRLFARLDESEMKSIDLHETLESVLTILASRLCAQDCRPAIALQTHYGQLPPIECYASQISHVLMHLITNAIDAIDTAWNAERRSSPAANSTPPILTLETVAPSPGWIMLTIRDTGIGIPADVCDRIFDVFYTTKPAGQGTGLGLAIAHQVVVEQHGGRLTCTSEPGQGTTFEIRLPTRLNPTHTWQPNLGLPIRESPPQELAPQEVVPKSLNPLDFHPSDPSPPDQNPADQSLPDRNPADLQSQHFTSRAATPSLSKQPN